MDQAAFETWAVSPAGGFPQEDLARDVNYEELYANCATRNAWEAFQAALAYARDSSNEPAWIAKLRKEVMMSKITNVFFLTRDECIELLGRRFYLLDKLASTRSKLQVWYGSMPEPNGKTNWTAILHNGDISAGMTIARSEYPDRVRYEADHVRWLIGELTERPFILDYDADKCSDYAIELQNNSKDS